MNLNACFQALLVQQRDLSVEVPNLNESDLNVREREKDRFDTAPMLDMIRMSCVHEPGCPHCRLTIVDRNTSCNRVQCSHAQCGVLLLQHVGSDV